MIVFLKIRNQCYQMSILLVVGSNGKYQMIKIFGIQDLDGLQIIKRLIKTLDSWEIEDYLSLLEMKIIYKDMLPFVHILSRLQMGI